MSLLLYISTCRYVDTLIILHVKCAMNKFNNLTCLGPASHSHFTVSASIHFYGGLSQRFIFRSGRISSVYIVGCWLWVGHTFSKLVNFECVGMLECV